MQFKYLNILGMGLGLGIKNFWFLGMGLGLGINNFRVLGMGLGLGIKIFWVLGMGLGLGIIPKPKPKTQNFLGVNVWSTPRIQTQYVLFFWVESKVVPD